MKNKLRADELERDGQVHPPSYSSPFQTSSAFSSPDGTVQNVWEKSFLTDLSGCTAYIHVDCIQMLFLFTDGSKMLRGHNVFKLMHMDMGYHRKCCRDEDPWVRSCCCREWHRVDLRCVLLFMQQFYDLHFCTNKKKDHLVVKFDTKHCTIKRQFKFIIQPYKKNYVMPYLCS